MLVMVCSYLKILLGSSVLKHLILNDAIKVEYKIFTAQVAFLWHIKLASDFLTLDVGPMLQYNCELELENKD